MGLAEQAISTRWPPVGKEGCATNNTNHVVIPGLRGTARNSPVRFGPRELPCLTLLWGMWANKGRNAGATLQTVATCFSHCTNTSCSPSRCSAAAPSPALDVVARGSPVVARLCSGVLCHRACFLV